MSSMKSFKSRISQKRGDSRSKMNLSTQSAAEFNLRNVAFSANSAFEFRLQKLGQRINITPYRLQISNNTGCRILLQVDSSHKQYFEISPHKYILENGAFHEVTIRVLEIYGAPLQEYARQTFTVTWARITQRDIENKIIPQLTQERVFRVTFVNKQLIDEMLARKTYQANLRIKQNNRNVQRNNNFLQASNLKVSKRSQFVRSGLNASDLQAYTEKQSLLRTNIIVTVAVISFIIGFLSS